MCAGLEKCAPPVHTMNGIMPQNDARMSKMEVPQSKRFAPGTYELLKYGVQRLQFLKKTTWSEPQKWVGRPRKLGEPNPEIEASRPEIWVPRLSEQIFRTEASGDPKSEIR